MCSWLLLAQLVALFTSPTVSHLVWTPILHDPRSQVDLWTQRETGCTCPFDLSRSDCACCVPDGGCHCNRAAPRRCAQCGLEQHCDNMCNITLDSRVLAARSGKNFGQIKSPSLEGPGFCWYRFLADRGLRIELQLYRLVSVGHFNGTRCIGGFLQFGGGSSLSANQHEIQLCGENERFSPPVVMFKDNGAATLLFRVDEKTGRSQFLAYFSFNPLEHPAVGIHLRGGKRVENTECDWVFSDYSCRELKKDKGESGCLLSSTGYPGSYPPHRKCKYLVTTSSIFTRVRLHIASLVLPEDRCDTDYLAVYKGTSPSSPLLQRLCGSQKVDLEYLGPNMLIEFSSGPSMPPYDHNGFVGSLHFTESSMGEQKWAPRHVANTICDYVVYANDSRWGAFSTVDTTWHAWPAACSLTFVGRPNDVVLLAMFNYQLRGPDCSSFVQVHDGSADGLLLRRLCSPVVKRARDASGKLGTADRLASTTNVMVLNFRRESNTEEEFVDGAFLFHDEQLEGTKQPDTLCDVVYYGITSAPVGRFGNLEQHQLYWNLEGPLQCSQYFVPAANQSVLITIESVERPDPNPHCSSQCGPSGCRCVTSLIPLSQADHLLLLTGDGHSLACFCGDFNSVLPVSVETPSALTAVYRVAHFNWARKGFNFTAVYQFMARPQCGPFQVAELSGSVSSRQLFGGSAPMDASGGQKVYVHRTCTWRFKAAHMYQLTIVFASPQNRNCSVWNFTVAESNSSRTQPVRGRLFRFCPREKRKEFTLPPEMQGVDVRLVALSATPVEFQLSWRSEHLVAEASRDVLPTQAVKTLSSTSGGQRPCNNADAIVALTMLITLLACPSRT